MSSPIEIRGEVNPQTRPLRFKDLWQIEAYSSLEGGFEIVRANNRNWAEISRHGHVSGHFDIQIDPRLTHGRMMLRSVLDGRCTHDSLYKVPPLFGRLMGVRQYQGTNVEPINTLEHWKRQARQLGQDEGWACELYRAMKLGEIAKKLVTFDEAMDVIDGHIEDDPYEFMVRFQGGFGRRDRLAALDKVYAGQDVEGRSRPELVLMDSHGNHGLVPNQARINGLYIELN